MDETLTFSPENRQASLREQEPLVIEELFSEKGLLKRSLPRYEMREDQMKMTQKIWECLEQENTALFEAGTGIGKSMAYLIPFLLWSFQTGERVVVSTYTISLQEQLVKKDLPLLLKALGLDLRVVLAKGMGNYVCVKRVDELSKQHGHYDSSLHALESWVKKGAKEGSRSDLPFSMSSESWNKIAADSDACAYIHCPHYKSCYFFKARQKAQDADLVVVNHHLLMAHLSSEGGQPLLPPFSRLVIDEAHHLEGVARSALTRVLDRVELFRILGKVHADSHPETSRLYFLRDLFKKKKMGALETRVGLDIPGEKRKLIDKIHDAFDLLERAFFAQSGGFKWRITEEMLKNGEWKKELIPPFLEVKGELKRYVASLESIEKELSDEVKELCEGALLEISSTVMKVLEIIETIELFFEKGENNSVRWAERSPRGVTLSLAQLDVAPFLEKKLFSPLKTAVLCSATLTVGKDFQHIRRSLGVAKGVEEVYPSPFDFKKRTKLLGISDLPPPNSYQFISEAAQVIKRAVQITGGGAFVLFTSYEMLNQCAEKLSDLNILRQTDTSRHLLLEEFKAQRNGILFGTDSFWEGVDVVGEGLRLVIIVKLPFPVPTDPLLEAKAELLKKEGRDPFYEDSVPQAVMKFKQGFGRLMRDKGDRGCVLCLDNRLFTKGYGKTFIESLPECITSYRKKSEIFEEMGGFYGV